MDAGRFRDRATFERRDVTIDDTGNQSGWTQLAVAWADLRENTGAQTQEAGALRGTTIAKARVRTSVAMRGVTVEDRVTIRGRLWDIRSAGAIIGRDVAMIEFELVAGGTA